MAENKLNPFEDNEDEYANSVANDAVELASERRERNVRKIDTATSDHAHVRRIISLNYPIRSNEL